MKSFLTFIKESVLEEGPLTHLTHPGSLPILAGSRGTKHALSALTTLHKAISGGTNMGALSTKFDGAPSFVYGKDEQGPYISTKSAFAKTPKISRSIEDIETHHGHAPGLVNKLSKAFTHLGKVVPEGMRIQGDIMHGGGQELHRMGNEVTFEPNTIRYGAKATSPEGKKAIASKVGVAIHTVYEGNTPRPITDKDRSRFSVHPDVHNISTKLEKLPEYDSKTKSTVEDHLNKASELHKKLGKSGYSAIEPHGEHIERYINSTVRNQTKPSVGGFTEYLKDRGEKNAEKVKTDVAKQRKRQEAQSIVDHVNKNTEHFDNAFQLSHHLQQATNHITRTIAKKSDFSHRIGDTETGPEGFVLYHKSNVASSPIKLVDREGFSVHNLSGKGAIAKEKATK